MTRLLLADDHAIVRSGLKQILSLTADLEVVGEASNGAEVMAQLRDKKFDLLVIDLNMPGTDGVDLIARIRHHYAKVPILVLSMHNEPQVAARVLKAGADGYLTKDCDPEVLLQAARSVALGGKFIAPHLAQQIVFNVNAASNIQPHLQLSAREQDVLRLLAQGYSVNRIAETLSISNKTVSTHKVRLMEKMQFHSIAELVRYAIEHHLVTRQS